jgi:WD40 repeat protein
LGDSLLVGSQNVSKTNVPGQILRYKLSNGRSDGAFVPSSKDSPPAPDSPFTPAGMALSKGVVIASDITNFDEPNDNLPPGRLLAYDAQTGKLLRQFDPPSGFPVNFHPRGVVIGPNGLLYVSNLPNTFPPPFLGGQVLVFDPETFAFLGVFINDRNDKGEVGHLNRPDSLVFGPDGKLYVTSFRASPTDTDSIRIYDGHTGAFIDKIDFYTHPAPPDMLAPRAFAQGIVFGPQGKLFAAMTEAVEGTPRGRIRRYDVQTKAFDVFAEVSNSTMLWYLIFGKTNPATLAYQGK